MNKTLITTDWHIGITIGDYDRKDDVNNSIQQIKDIVVKEKPDTLVHCGDVFHSNRNLSENINVFIEFCHFLKAHNVVGYFLVGNHDLVEQVGKTHALDIDIEGIHIIDEITQVEDYLFIPHISRSKSNKTPEELLEELAIRVDAGAEKFWVFAHCNVAYFELPDQVILKFNHHALPQKLIESDNVNAIFDGHYHKTQDGLGSQDNFYFVGTPQTFSMEEKDDAKRVMMLDGGVVTSIPLTATVFKEYYLDFVADYDKAFATFNEFINAPNAFRNYFVKIVGRINEADLVKIDMVALRKVLGGHVAYLYNPQLSIVREKKYRLAELGSGDTPDKAIEKFCEKYNRGDLVELAKSYIGA